MNALDLLAIANVLVPLIETGVTSFTRIRGFLRAEGATDEQLAALDGRLTEAIARREAERDDA